MNIALVLTGGGARAAYQVGVLQGVQQLIDEHQAPFNIYVGSSGGAINATHLAAHYGQFSTALKELHKLWGNLTTSQVYSTGLSSIVRITGQLARDLIAHRSVPRSFHSFMDSQPLRDLILSHQTHQRLHQQIANGDLKGLSIACTSLSEASTIHFVETAQAIPPWHRHRRRCEFSRITVDHIMASSAIPLLFPPVKIGEHYFADGSTRNIFPLSPAIRLGCDRILAIGVRNDDDEYQPVYYEPSIARQTSVLLNAMFFDAVDSDLEQLAIKNEIAKNNAGNTQLREIKALMISPSKDPATIALQHQYEAPKALTFLLNSLGTIKEAAALLSYLLFEADFMKELIALGYQDAIKHQSDIMDLFN